MQEHLQTQRSIPSFVAHIEQTLNTQSYAFISMNIKNFNGINLRFGSTFGDLVLNQIECILEQALYPHEVYNHIYGDIFELWLNFDDTHPLQERIYHIDDLIYQLSDKRIHQSIFLSFGIYIPQLNDKVLHMRACADFCRSQSHDCAKLNTHIEFYNDALKTAYIHKLQLVNALRKGFVKKAFYMVLQPKISVSSKQIIGAEALLRWHDDSLNTVSTQEMILVSEQNGFVRELDLYMFEQVCSLLQTWFSSYHSYPNISVNVSRYHFENPSFFQAYLTIFKAYHIPAHTIEFEITETAIVQDFETFRLVVKQMHHHGFRVALDDFGSGASSLVNLKDLPISTLKLDRCFFLEESKTSRLIVKAMIQMAKQLHITSVCEGIETDEQETFLIECGADMIQGYLYYPPISIQQFEELYFPT